MKPRFALTVLAGTVLLAVPSQAWAATALAAAVQSSLMAGRAIAAVLAVTVLGFFFLTGRSATQSVLPLLIGLFMLGAVGEIIDLVQGDWTALTGFFLGWLRSLLYSVLVIVLLLLGYSYWFGGGSWRALYPVLWGIVIVLGAGEFAGAAMG